jgi:hypothetical protein
MEQIVALRKVRRRSEPHRKQMKLTIDNQIGRSIQKR